MRAKPFAAADTRQGCMRKKGLRLDAFAADRRRPRFRGVSKASSAGAGSSHLVGLVFGVGEGGGGMSGSRRRAYGIDGQLFALDVGRANGRTRAMPCWVIRTASRVATMTIAHAASRRRWLCPGIRGGVGSSAPRPRLRDLRLSAEGFGGAGLAQWRHRLACGEDPDRGRQAQHRDSTVAMRRAISGASKPGATPTSTPDVSFTSKVVEDSRAAVSRVDVTRTKPRGASWTECGGSTPAARPARR